MKQQARLLTLMRAMGATPEELSEEQPPQPEEGEVPPSEGAPPSDGGPDGPAEPDAGACTQL